MITCVLCGLLQYTIPVHDYMCTVWFITVHYTCTFGCNDCLIIPEKEIDTRELISQVLEVGRICIYPGWKREDLLDVVLVEK